MLNPRSDCTSEDLPAPDHWSVAANAAFEAQARWLLHNEGNMGNPAIKLLCTYCPHCKQWSDDNEYVQALRGNYRVALIALGDIRHTAEWCAKDEGASADLLRASFAGIERRLKKLGEQLRVLSE